MPWDQFLMKILLKKEDCESREQCMRPTGKQTTATGRFLKKKKKRETQNARCWEIH